MKRDKLLEVFSEDTKVSLNNNVTIANDDKVFDHNNTGLLEIASPVSIFITKGRVKKNKRNFPILLPGWLGSEGAIYPPSSLLSAMLESQNND